AQAAIDVPHDRRTLLVRDLIEVLADLEPQQLGERVRHQMRLHVAMRAQRLFAWIPVLADGRAHDIAANCAGGNDLACHGDGDYGSRLSSTQVPAVEKPYKSISIGRL